MQPRKENHQLGSCPMRERYLSCDPGLTYFLAEGKRPSKVKVANRGTIRDAKKKTIDMDGVSGSGYLY